MRRYLSHVMNVATPTKDCLELVNELLEPIMKAKSEKILTRQEVCLSTCDPTQIKVITLAENEGYLKGLIPIAYYNNNREFVS